MRASSGNNLVFVDPKILQTDTNPSPSTSQRQKQEAYLYGDNWSTDDDEDDDDIDEVYGHGKVPPTTSSPGSPTLTIGRRGGKDASTIRPSCLPIPTTSSSTTTTTFNESSLPKSSLLDEIESEYMQTEFCRKRITPDQTPMASQPPPPPPPTSLPPSQSFPNLTDIQSAIDHRGDEDDNEDEDEHIESELIDEEALDAIDNDADEEDDEMPSDALELQKKQTYQSRLPEPQPLYQIYMLHEQEKMLEVGASATTSGASSASGDTGIVEADSCCGSLVAENEDSLSSIIRRQSSSISTDSGRGCDSSSNLTSNTSMRRERLTAASIYGSQRSLWCELPEVKSAGLLNQLDDNSKKLQEAFFEVITSEASYLRSINFLINHFISAPEFLGTGMKPSIITAAERKHLFSNIINVRDCSERLLCDLENRLEDNLVLSDVNDILCEHFEKYFDSYVKYCSNQVYQDRTLKRLKALNPHFLSCINRIETDRRCQGLDMRSFLMLPMQRVTRYPLLVYAILERVPQNSEIQRIAAKALLLANHVVRNCNEGARRMERTEQLLDIERRLIYKTADLKRIPLVTSGRYVVKNGQVLQIYERRAKGLLQTKQKTRNLYLFLFSDMLLIAKKRVNGTFICKDYAQRRFVVVEPVEAHSHKVPIGAIASLPSKSHLFVCILLQNAFGKQVELLLNVESESDRERWLTAMRPPTCSNPDEKIYAEWDCPQAVGVHHYSANQEDELELEPGDLINILRKMPDGKFFLVF
uniref:DH domain-containing protein n=2 Tax=Panagrolaimus superbus TaxID=310955 RepID=A0A914Z7E3_9BILA